VQKPTAIYLYVVSVKHNFFKSWTSKDHFDVFTAPRQMRYITAIINYLSTVKFEFLKFVYFVFKLFIFWWWKLIFITCAYVFRNISSSYGYFNIIFPILNQYYFTIYDLSAHTNISSTINQNLRILIHFCLKKKIMINILNDSKNDFTFIIYNMGYFRNELHNNSN